MNFKNRTDLNPETEVYLILEANPIGFFPGIACGMVKLKEVELAARKSESDDTIESYCNYFDFLKIEDLKDDDDEEVANQKLKNSYEKLPYGEKINLCWWYLGRHGDIYRFYDKKDIYPYLKDCLNSGFYEYEALQWTSLDHKKMNFRARIL